MENKTHFHSLKDLIRTLDRERRLLSEMFAKRKKMMYRHDAAKELASKSDESMDFLRRYGIIRENADFVELDDVYLHFFEDVLEVNEEIDVASVKQSIESLNRDIEFYLLENSQSRKLTYLSSVKKMLMLIANNVIRSVIDLKRNIDNTYKNEPNIAIKKKKLEILDEKRRAVSLLIRECEAVIDDKQPTFFLQAMDSQLQEIVIDVKYQLHEAYHNLIELDRQIISYLNLIAYQGRLIEKVQKLKYLRDQLILEANTDLEQRLLDRNPVWMEPRARYSLKPSLSVLRNSELGLAVLRDVSQGKLNGMLRHGRVAEALTDKDLNQGHEELAFVDVSAVKNAFLLSDDHLFNFILNYSGYPKEMQDEDLLVLFCQVAAQFYDEIEISDSYGTYKDYEYPLIYPHH